MAKQLPLKFLGLRPAQDATEMELNPDPDLRHAQNAMGAGKLRTLKDFSQCPGHVAVVAVKVGSYLILVERVMGVVSAAQHGKSRLEFLRESIPDSKFKCAAKVKLGPAEALQAISLSLFMLFRMTSSLARKTI